MSAGRRLIYLCSNAWLFSPYLFTKQLGDDNAHTLDLFIINRFVCFIISLVQNKGHLKMQWVVFENYYGFLLLSPLGGSTNTRCTIIFIEIILNHRKMNGNYFTEKKNKCTNCLIINNYSICYMIMLCA